MAAGSVPTHRSFVSRVAHDLRLALNNDPDYEVRGVQDNLWTVRGNVEDARVSVGQSAVDCRRALGKLDDQYLWTGVHLLWTGADDETLAMAPTRLLPEETRQAMATGFTSAFRDAMVARRLAARRAGAPAVATLAWLLDTPEVRDAVFDSARQRGADTKLLESLDNDYRDDSAGGSTRVMQMYEATPEDRRFLVTLFEALLMLLKQDGVPVRAAETLERTQVTAPYHRLRADLHRMLNAFFLLGANPETNWCRADRFRTPGGGGDDEDDDGADEDDDGSGVDITAVGATAAADERASAALLRELQRRPDDFDRRAKSLERTLGRLVAERDEQKLSHEELARALRGLVPETEALAQRRETQNEEGDLPPSYVPRDDEEGPRHVPSGAPPSLESAPSGGMITGLAKILVPGASGAATARAAATGDLCDPLVDGVFDSSQQAAEALLVAWRRTRGVEPRGPSAVQAGWALRGNVAPFWESREPEWWENEFFREGYTVPSPVDLATLHDLLDRKVGLAAARRRVTNPEQPHIHGEDYVRFVVARGLCALPGPHEVPLPGKMESAFRYTYPRTPLPTTASQLEAMWARWSGSAKSPDKQWLSQVGQRMQTAEVTLYDSRIAQDADLAEATSDTLGVQQGDFAHNAMRSTEEGQPNPVAGQEPARQVRWAPVKRAEQDVDYELDTSLEAIHYSRAAVLEHLLVFLGQVLQQNKYDGANPAPTQERVARTLRAIVAAIKLRQMSSLAFVAHSRRAGVAPSKLMLEPDPDRWLVTRPPVLCEEGIETDDDGPMVAPMLYPADAGLRQFEAGEGTTPLERQKGPTPEMEDNDDAGSGPVYGCYRGTTAGPNRLDADVATGRLREGLRAGPGEDSLYTSRPYEEPMLMPAESTRARADLYLGRAAERTPFLRAPERGVRAWGVASRVPIRASLTRNMRAAALAGMHAIKEEQQIECEEEMLERLQTEGSAERMQLFSLTPSAETGSRDRRTGLWQEALREIAVSCDPLHRFVRMLSGGLNEKVSDLLQGEDPDVLRLQKQLQEQRRETAKRSIAFQARMIEQVLGGIFKSSALSLDLAEHQRVGDGRDNHLMVRSAVAKQALKEAATGSGRPFFEATLQLQNMIEGGQGEIALHDMVRELLHLGATFQKRLGEDVDSATSGARLSREALTLPRNSYMIRLNDTVCTAIWDTFVELGRRLRQHSHFVRRVYLWELIEGPSTSTSSIFAELVRAQLQFTRATDTSATAYVSQVMKSSIAFKLELSYRKMVKELCDYVYRFGLPNFDLKDRRPPLRVLSPPPAADGDDDDDDGDDSRGLPGILEFDPAVLGKFWSNMHDLRTKRAAAARTKTKPQKPTTLLTGGAGHEPAPATRRAFISYLFGRIQNMGPAAVHLLKKIFWTLQYFSNNPAWYLLREASDMSATYFGYLDDDVRNHVVAMSRAVGNMGPRATRSSNDPKTRLVQYDEATSRWKPSLDTTLTRITENGFEKYQLTIAAERFTMVPKELLDNPELMSTALNEMYELPHPGECNDARWKGRLKWVPSKNGRVWTRYRWENDNNGGGDDYHRGLRDQQWLWMHHFTAALWKIPSRVTMYNMALLFILGVMAYGTWHSADFGGSLGGAVYAAMDLVTWMVTSGVKLVFSAFGQGAWTITDGSTTNTDANTTITGDPSEIPAFDEYDARIKGQLGNVTLNVTKETMQMLQPMLDKMLRVMNPTDLMNFLKSGALLTASLRSSATNATGDANDTIRDALNRSSGAGIPLEILGEERQPSVENSSSIFSRIADQLASFRQQDEEPNEDAPMGSSATAGAVAMAVSVEAAESRRRKKKRVPESTAHKIARLASAPVAC